MTHEHDELASVVRSALADWAPGGSRWVSDPGPGDPERFAAWTVLAGDLQLAGLTVPESAGGAGDLSDALVVATELGRALLHSPFVASTVRAAAVLSGAGGQDALLGRIAAGEATVVVADATLEDGEGLSGDLGRVVSAGDADAIIVPVSTADGLGLRLVETAASGVAVTRSASVDPGWPEDRVMLDGAPSRPVPTAADVAAVLSSARSAALLAYSAEAVGAASAALDQAVAYAKQRVQFGEPIGSFQAVQHAAADMFVRVETAGALSRESALALGRPGVADEALAATTYLYCTEAALAVAGQAIQLQGGIGFTWEHSTHRCFKRVAALRSMPATPGPQRERLLVAIGGGELA